MAADPRTEIELRIEQRMAKFALGLFSLFGLQFLAVVFAAGVGWQKLDYVGTELVMLRGEVSKQGSQISTLVADGRSADAGQEEIRRRLDRMESAR